LIACRSQGHDRLSRLPSRPMTELGGTHVKHHPIRCHWLLLAALMAVLIVLPAGSALGNSGGTAPASATVKWAATISDGRVAAKALLKKSGAASFSLALVGGNKVIWQQAFGYADKATSTAPRSTTMYGLGSVSKMLAAVATMKLVDQGLVSLDTPVYRYIPSFRMADPAYRQITVRMLLDHSSGMPGADYDNMMTGDYDPTYVDQVMAALATARLKTTPGYMSVYCNDGFTMIEKLVSSVTGKSYAQFVADEVFTPLGMTGSKYPLTHFPDGAYAKVYTGSDTSVANPQEVVNTLASGGLYSTPSDMAKLASMLMNGGVSSGTRILSAASVAAMGANQLLRTYDPAPSNAINYGLGWDTVTEPGLKALGLIAWCKGGDSGDYHAAFIVAPSVGMAVILQGVAPLSSTDLEGLGQRILLHALVDKGSLRRMPAKLPQTAPPSKKASVGQLADMTGFWAMYSRVVRIAQTAPGSQSLSLTTLDGYTWPEPMSVLRLRRDGRFHAKGDPTSYRTLHAGNRDYLVMNAIAGYGHYRGDLMVGQKLEANEPLSYAWQTRMGHTWLEVNMVPGSVVCAMDEGPNLTMGEVPGLQGYVRVLTAAGTQLVDPSKSDSTGFMFLQIPLVGSRDLNDVVMSQHGSEEWVSVGYGVYRPQATVPELAAGANAVTFGAAGNAEWRKLPAAGQLTIEHASAWFLYDSSMKYLASGTTSPATAAAAQAGCYLMIHGAAGSTVTVTAAP
jgi:CubicO group peptidase (beta-lactamase class C family)